MTSRKKSCTENKKLSVCFTERDGGGGPSNLLLIGQQLISADPRQLVSDKVVARAVACVVTWRGRLNSGVGLLALCNEPDFR